MTKEEALKIASGTVQELRAQARTSREAYWLNGAADVIEALASADTLPQGQDREAGLGAEQG